MSAHLWIALDRAGAPARSQPARLAASNRVLARSSRPVTARSPVALARPNDGIPT